MILQIPLKVGIEPIAAAKGKIAIGEKLEAIETCILSRDLKARKAVNMAQVVGGQGEESKLQPVAWMDFVDTEITKDDLSTSTRGIQ